MVLPHDQDEIELWALEFEPRIAEMIHDKFSQSKLCRAVLVATGDAHLLHQMKRAPKHKAFQTIPGIHETRAWLRREGDEEVVAAMQSSNDSDESGHDTTERR